MSIKIMDWVFDNSKSQGLERLILLVIADHCNHDGEHAFPRISVIAKRANVSERTVKRRLQDLVALGELEITSRAGTSNLYKIIRKQEPKASINEPLTKNFKEKTVPTRPRNVIWDSLLDVCGVNPNNVNSQEASRYGKLCKLLKESNATPEQIEVRALVYKQKFPQAPLTPSALVNRWSECDPEHNQKMNGLKGVVPEGWNAIQAAREERILIKNKVKIKGELNV